MTTTTDLAILNTSPSQLKTYEDLCKRKWWFRHVHDLLEPKRSFQAFGTAVHGVIERYLRADAMGRDRTTNKAVELYPEGWETTKEGAVLLPAEVDRIKQLITIGIEKGVIYRPTGDYAVEHEYYWRPPGIREHGFVDLIESDGITDHKTTSNTRWSLSEDEIYEDWQMRAYAMQLVRSHLENGSTPPEHIRLRHNIFTTKDDLKVFSREVTITPAVLMEHEATVFRTFGEMIDLKKVGIDQWEMVDGPRPGSDACNAFRGCPYRNICQGREKPEQYRLRMINANKSPAQLLEEGKMAGSSMIANLLKRPAAAPALAQVMLPPATPQPAVPFTQVHSINPPPAAAPPVSAAPIIDTAPVLSLIQAAPAPWYNAAGCRSCSKNAFPGFSSNLLVCRVCEAVAARDGRRTSMSYKVSVKDGIPTWEDPGGAVEPIVHVVVNAITDGIARGELDLNKAMTADSKRQEVEIESLRNDDSISDEEYVRRMEAGEPLVERTVQETSPGLERDEPVVEAPKRRGRPAGSKNRPKDGMVVTQEVLGPPQVSPFLVEGPIEQTQSIHEPVKKQVQVAELTVGVGLDASAMQALAIALGDIKAELTALRELIALQPVGIRPAIGISEAAYEGIQQVLDAAEKQAAPVPVPVSEGFTLAIGCRPRTGVRVVDLNEWLRPYQAELAADMKVASYYQIKAFERWDAIRAVLPTLVEELNGAWLFVPSESDPDTNAFLGTLRGLAAQVVE